MAFQVIVERFPVVEYDLPLGLGIPDLSLVPQFLQCGGRFYPEKVHGLLRTDPFVRYVLPFGLDMLDHFFEQGQKRFLL